MWTVTVGGAGVASAAGVSVGSFSALACAWDAAGACALDGLIREHPHSRSSIRPDAARVNRTPAPATASPIAGPRATPGAIGACTGGQTGPCETEKTGVLTTAVIRLSRNEVFGMSASAGTDG